MKPRKKGSKFFRYFWNILVSIDQFFNTIFAGDPDETISSRVGKWARDGKHRKGWKKIVHDIVHFVVEIFEKDHLKKHIEEDEGDDAVLK
jgi:hypothetical protein